MQIQQSQIKFNNYQPRNIRPNNVSSNILHAPISTNFNNNYGELIVNRPKINFRANNETSPLQDKINHACDCIRQGNIVLVAPDLETGQKNLIKNIESISPLITSITFVEDKNLKNSFVITKESLWAHLINIGEEPIIYEGSGILKLNKKLNTGSKVNMTNNKLSLANGETLKEPNHVSISFHSKYDFPVFSFYANKSNNAKLNKINVKNLTQHKDDKFLTRDLEEVLNNRDKEVIETTNISSTKNDLPLKKTKSTYPTFADIGGQNELIKELKKSILYPIKKPKLFDGVKINKGIILYGQAGTGKTLVAQALANECNANFMKIDPLEKVNKYVGVSEKLWRDTFNEARQNQPCIVFIDEFDSVAQERDGDSQARHDNKTVNQLLQIMSDIEKNNDQIFVVAATNKIDLIDGAIKRSGRFGKHLEVKKPDEIGCRQIFDIHTKSLKLSDNITDDVKNDIAKNLYSHQSSGADIQHICTESHMEMLDRNNVFEKIDNDVLTDEEIESYKIEKQDIEASIKKRFSEQS